MDISSRRHGMDRRNLLPLLEVSTSRLPLSCCESCRTSSCPWPVSTLDRMWPLKPMPSSSMVSRN